LADIIKKDYPTFSGLALEMYFRQQMMESKEFADIGSWWQGRNNKDQDEIDIVGLYAEEKKALVAEVKRQSKNFKPDLLIPIFAYTKNSSHTTFANIFYYLIFINFISYFHVYIY